MLTEEQTAYYESRLGTPLDVPDIEERFARLGTGPRVATEILEVRLATMLNRPLSFSIPGDYSEDRKGNVDYIRRMLELARSEADGDPGPSIMSSVMAPERWAR